MSTVETANEIRPFQVDIPDEALGRGQLAQPRAAGPRTALSVRLAARRSAVQAAGDAQRRLHALVVAAPEILRERLRGRSTRQLAAGL